MVQAGLHSLTYTVQLHGRRDLHRPLAPFSQITMISRAIRNRPTAAADLRKQFRNPPQTATVQHILASLAKSGQAHALPDGRYVV